MIYEWIYLSYNYNVIYNYMTKILVTGGTSYIGKHCIAQLVEKEYDVVATIRDISKSESILSDLNQYLNMMLLI